MPTLLLELGPLAHLALGEGPLTGQQMLDDESLVEAEGQGIFIDEGVIQRISESDEMRAEYIGGKRGFGLVGEEIEGITVIEAGGRAVVPGLVDSHTHLLWGGDRSREMRWRLQGESYQSIAKRGGGIVHTVQQTRSMRLEDLITTGLARVEIALSNGTTAMEVKSGYGLSTDSELRLLEAASQLQGVSIDSTWLGAHAPPPEMERGAYVEQILAEQLPAVLESGLAQSADVFCEPGWFTLEETEDICKAAMDGGLDIRLHVDEFVDGGGLSLAAELGALSGDHAHWSDSQARAEASAAGTLQCFLPGTPFSMGETHFPPANECIESEFPWCAASDFNPNCQILSLPFIGNLLSQRMGVDPLASLVAVSRNSACVTRHEKGLKHGMLVEGGAADLNILDSPFWESWCQRPGISPFAATMKDGDLMLH